MISYSEKVLINCVHSDPGGCMCIIYFLISKCDTFSLLANTHDPQNRFQKLNEIHRRRLSHWNCHTDLLTFVAKSHHCHQALAMINNATNDSLANWIVLWTLTYPVLLVKALKFVPKGPINNIPALIQIMAWRRPGDKPLSEPMIVSLPTHICVTRPQWVKWKMNHSSIPKVH